MEYNFPAADADNNIPYGDPWQLVWIFDDDPDTKVVCEGYAKGFNYLCDLSRFKGDVGCVLITGMMYHGTGGGPHMWNSLKMPDGKCYLVDLTNCDAGDTCNYSLFLKGCTGEAGGPYVCAGIEYVFDSTLWDQFGAGSPWLTYSNVDYGEEDVTAWSAFQQKINDADNHSTVTLTEDLTAGSGYAGLLIPAGKTLTLDLAGHTLNRGLMEAENDGYVVGIIGSLTVTDSVGGGKITGGWTRTYGGGIYVDYGASLTLEGGTICNNEAYYGGGIGTHKGNITISGGKISNNRSAKQGGGVMLESGKIVMRGGEISGNQSSSGGGVWLMNGKFEMKGGKINNNQGQGLYIRSSSSKMSGGEISGNEGNGVNILYGVFTLSGGCIAKNNSSESGGGIKIEGETGKSVLKISGGVIRNNTTAMEGGGICSTGGDVQLVIAGGEITGNTAAMKAGGVCLSKNNKFSGSPVISGNHSGKGNAIIDSNCVIEDGQKIIVVGALDRSARIGVTKLDTTYSSVFTKGLGANGNIGAFFSDNPQYEITWSKNGKEAMLFTTKVKLTECKFTVKDQVYTGKALTPAVTVKYGKKTLKQDTDYTLAYKDNKNVGVATVTVTGMGGYTGTKNLNFKILPRKNVISKVSVKDNTATLTLKRRAEATGYQVQYGLKSNFAGAKSITVKQAKTVKATLKSLKAGKTYYVRVRTYKTVGKKTYYSAWSGKKNIKVK